MGCGGPLFFALILPKLYCGIIFFAYYLLIQNGENMFFC
ncbi:hypothetical protein JCM19538_1885 [Jejuia pallidilutea]|uniref:Uncharacterized protein n=1 Tax=Jejuia pallidilutea TaxID=504487 RepID=A0A098LPQ7_9FLAO|nr:hypothetical protein JCM19538_1885 [Jejuia pallidilutea]